MGTQVAVTVSEIVSHVHNLSTYEGAQVTNMFQIYSSVFRNIEIYQVQPDWVYIPERYGSRVI